jgi:hypothetical protein
MYYAAATAATADATDTATGQVSGLAWCYTSISGLPWLNTVSPGTEVTFCS